jgi:hypothetical protein
MIWNDRPWTMKVVTNENFPLFKGGPNPVPVDFGSVESKGAGLYCHMPMAWLRPLDIGELNMLRHGTNLNPLAFGVHTRYSIQPDGVALYPPITQDAEATFVYLRRAPRCIYEAVPDADELFWIPEQWHDLVSDGARWMNSHDIASKQESAEQAFTKLGLDNMRAREDWGQQGINRITGFRPVRRGLRP